MFILFQNSKIIIIIVYYKSEKNNLYFEYISERMKKVFGKGINFAAQLNSSRKNIL